MPSANKTPNYGLTQYADNGSDKVSVMGDYNRDMSKIDDGMKQNADRLATAQKTADAAKTAAATAETDAQNAQKTADAAKTAAATAETDAQNAQKTADAAKTAATDNKNSLANVYTKPDVDAKFTLKGVSYTKSEADSRFYVNKHMPENIVIAGDSITYGTGASSLQNSWGNRLKSWRGSDAVTNLAQNNAGYTNATTFLQQLQSYSGDRSTVSHVIVAGGANDKLNTANNAVFTAAMQTYDYIAKNFPNAKIIAIPVILGLFAYNTYNSNIPETIRQIENAISQNRKVTEIPYGWEWLGGNETWSADFSIHPNDSGNSELLRIISNCIDSRQSYRNSWVGKVYAASNHGNITHGNVSVNGGIASIDCQMTIVNGDCPAYTPFMSASNAIASVDNAVVANSLNKLIYTFSNDSNQGHRCSFSCTQAIANNTEIYLQKTVPVGA